MKKVNYSKDFKSSRSVLCSEATINELVDRANKKGEHETGTGNTIVQKFGRTIIIYQAIAEAKLY